MRGKLTVVWLCHFSNNEIQDILLPTKRINEFSPWITLSIRIFEKKEEVELHIISPHEYISGYKAFNLRGIHYHFFNAHIPFIGRHWPEFFKWDYISNFSKNKRVTRSIVKNINPDIIHLHGAENAYYSSTIFQFLTKYPSILTVQGFINKSNSKRTYKIKKRINIEKRIFENIKNSFYRTQTMAEDIKKRNPKVNLFWNTYPNSFSSSLEQSGKIFDVVFFAKLTKEKGIEDLLKGIFILKKTNPDISLCVIGSGRLDKYKRLSNELGIEGNITWAGFLPTQNDVHKLASKARISVLPTYHDIISGTILESMFLRLPVVAYNVGSISEVNEKEVIISLVDKLDIKGLAKAIKFLLDNPKILEERAEKGFQRAQEMFVHSDEEIFGSLINTYTKVINCSIKQRNN